MPRQSEKRQRVRLSAKQRAETHRSGYQSTTLDIPGDVEKFVLKAGTRRIDIIPYRVLVDSNPEANKGDLYYERTYYIHNGIGPNNDRAVCPSRTAGKPCPVCEYRSERAKDPNADEKEIRDLAPKERQLFNVIDVEDRDKGVQVWDFSFHLFGKLLDSEVKTADDDDEYEFFPDLETGFTLKLGVEEKSFGTRKFSEVKTIGFKKRIPQYTDSILAETHDLDSLIMIPTYDELRKSFLQTEGGKMESKNDDTPKKESKQKNAAVENRFKEGDLLVNDEFGIVEMVMFSPDGTKVKVKDDEGKLHVVEVDDLRDRPDNPCVSCRGWGKNSKGGKCSPCKGTGVHQVKENTDDLGTGSEENRSADDWGTEEKVESEVKEAESNFDDWD